MLYHSNVQYTVSQQHADTQNIPYHSKTNYPSNTKLGDDDVSMSAGCHILVCLCVLLWIL